MPSDAPDSTSAPALAELARAMADDSRATMLLALLDGRAWTAGELAAVAGVARPTASGHLDRLLSAGLVVERRQGRHRYVRIEDPEAPLPVQGPAPLPAAPGPARPPAPPPRAQRADAALREARTCYRHLAGRRGVELAEGLRRRGLVGAGWELTEAGRRWWEEHALDPGTRRRGAPIRPCLDWTERTDHIAGPAAESLLDHLVGEGALRRRSMPRALAVESDHPLWAELGVR